ncbi:MAG: tripartite tricarboxylate transporter substrate binding protein [Burkholderiales bacterium]
MSTRSVLFQCLVIGAVLACATDAAFSQTKLTRPIRLIVPLAPGGGTDIIARLFAPYISEEFGQQVVIDNRGGAGTVIGTQMIARATPDGHTLGMIDSAFIINPALLTKLPYDTFKDFAPISLVRAAPLFLLVNVATPVNSFADFLAYAKERPGNVTYGAATGSGIHLAGEQLRAATGLDLVHVPYKGGGPVLAELSGGQITMAFFTGGTARPYVTSGRLRPIATTSPKRSPIFPEVITFLEAGLPSVDSITINGLIAPAGTPRDLVVRLNALVTRVLKSRELEKRLPDLRAEAGSGTPEDFGRFIRTDVAKWQKVVKAAGIKVD